MARQMRYGITYILVGLVVLWLFQQFILGAAQRPRGRDSVQRVSPEAGRRADHDRRDRADADFRRDEERDLPAGGGRSGASRLPGRGHGCADRSGDDRPGGAGCSHWRDPGHDGHAVRSTPTSRPAAIRTWSRTCRRRGWPYSFTRPASPIGAFLLSWILPLALLAGFWYLLFRARSGGGAGMGGGGLGNIFGVGKSKAQEVKPEDVGVTYKDVGGADEAIAELQEIIQFLKSPEQFAKLGGRIPEGRAARRPARHRQDAAGQGNRGRGWRLLLRDERLRVRGDVRRRRRGACARPVRAGPQGRPGGHLHRRDRRDRRRAAA